jgi:hypothetical protein
MADFDGDPPTIDLPIVRETPCRHLRNKGMYVYTDDVSGEAHEDYDNTIYWCLQTMKSFGPDDGMVEGHDCRNPGRSCYEAT